MKAKTGSLRIGKSKRLVARMIEWEKAEVL
jgi:hypothetical protein